MLQDLNPGRAQAERQAGVSVTRWEDGAVGDAPQGGDAVTCDAARMYGPL